MRHPRLSMVLPIAFALAPVAWGQASLPGFPKITLNDQTGAPLFFDMDGDGIDELLHANGDHKTDIWRTGGIAFPGFPQTTGWHVWNMTPAVGDIDGDGDFEIVTACADYRVYAFHHNGATVAGFPRYVNGELSGAACLADLDNDGDLEILVQPRGSIGLVALQGDGTMMPGWPVKVSTNEGGSQTMAAADLDGDGILEIIATSQGIGSVLSVVHPDGTPVPGFPIVVTYLVGSPAIADLDRDGDLEIIAPVGSDMYAWHHDGTVVSGFPTKCGTYSLYTSPAVGDLDRDGYVEIAFGSQNGSVYVVAANGKIMPGWPIPTPGVVHATPVLVDLDFDGDLEILVTTPTSGSGGVYAWHHKGTPVAGFPWATGSSYYGGLSLGDLNGDGRLDLAAGARSGKGLYAWTSPFDYDATRIVHGHYRVNRHNNAVHDLRPLDGMFGVWLKTPPKAYLYGLLKVTAYVENNSPLARGADLTIWLEEPNGSRWLMLDEPVVLNPGETSVFDVQELMSPNMPPGGYRVIAKLTDTAGRVVHWDGELVTFVPGLVGDLNCDGHVDFGDINPFVLALTNLPLYEQQYPGCPFANRDINGDGRFDFGDINPFVKLLTNP